MSKVAGRRISTNTDSIDRTELTSMVEQSIRCISQSMSSIYDSHCAAQDSQAETTDSEEQPSDSGRVKPDFRCSLSMTFSEGSLVKVFLDIIIGKPSENSSDETW
jgi:hypothetical protein